MLFTIMSLRRMMLNSMKTTQIGSQTKFRDIWPNKKKQELCKKNNNKEIIWMKLIHR